MFYDGKRVDQALAIARDAKASIETHVAEDLIRHDQIQVSLKKQDVVLDRISAFMSRCTWGILAALFAIVWWGVTSTVHIKLVDLPPPQSNVRIR